MVGGRPSAEVKKSKGCKFWGRNFKSGEQGKAGGNARGERKREVREDPLTRSHQRYLGSCEVVKCAAMEGAKEGGNRWLKTYRETWEGKSTKKKVNHGRGKEWCKAG